MSLTDYSHSRQEYNYCRSVNSSLIDGIENSLLWHKTHQNIGHVNFLKQATHATSVSRLADQYCDGTSMHQHIYSFLQLYLVLSTSPYFTLSFTECFPSRPWNPRFPWIWPMFLAASSLGQNTSRFLWSRQQQNWPPWYRPVTWSSIRFGWCVL